MQIHFRLMFMILSTFIWFRCRVAQAYLNQKRLDAEAKQLHVNATNFAKQTQQWMSLIEGFSCALKVLNKLLGFQMEDIQNAHVDITLPPIASKNYLLLRSRWL